ncbi:MAG TPA: hypothetical protein VHS53_06770 [Mucilaginibacter sp.]|nr:hypothetical protein [Mucilaginibacter sp.]
MLARYRATLHPEVLYSYYDGNEFEPATFPTKVGTRYRATLHPEKGQQI